VEAEKKWLKSCLVSRKFRRLIEVNDLNSKISGDFELRNLLYRTLAQVQ
jgi:hypothetical protein